MKVQENKKAPDFSEACRAENEARTRDPNLGKVVLYQLSYFRMAFSLVLGTGIEPVRAFLPTGF